MKWFSKTIRIKEENKCQQGSMKLKTKGEQRKDRKKEYFDRLRPLLWPFRCLYLLSL
jgi:hypothetical protein